MSLTERLLRRLARERFLGGLWLSDQFRTRWHDRVAARRLRTVAGQVPLSDRVAIMAVYPRNGIRPTHLRALRRLQEQGFAVLLISNLPLSAEDQARLAPHVWQQAVRPNFGYDIGAYRAGILWLAGQEGGLARLSRLVLTNDSIWWPLAGGVSDWLDTAERIAHGGDAPDLIGAISNFAVQPVPLGQKQRWQVNDRNPDFHYCSFALSLGPAVLCDPDFRAFWKRMRLTDDKIQMILRGEVALSRWSLAHGHSHAGCWDAAGFADRLDALDEGQLAALLAQVIIPADTSLRAARDDLLQGTDRLTGKPAILNALLTLVAATGPAYALPSLIAHEPGVGFIKVSPLRLDADGRRATLEALEQDQELLAEAALYPLSG